MKVLNGMFTGAFTSLSNSVASCCGALDEKPRRHHPEKSFGVLDDQPSSVPPPSAEPAWRTRRTTSTWEHAPKRKNNASGRSSFSVRRGLLSKVLSSRRPQISAPSNFRHVYSDSFQIWDQDIRPWPRSFRPLELSIYQPHSRLSPILPHFDYPSPPVTPPDRAVTHSNGDYSDGSHSLSHERSYSTMSFHIPRKPTNTVSVSDSIFSDTVKRPSPPRARAYTSSEAETSVLNDLIEKVASATLERDRLQKEINDVVEAQSIYVSSRPSTAHSMRPLTARSVMEMEPMPGVPALPPNAPSFSERLSFDRPQTAPSKTPVHIPYRAKSFSEASAAFDSSSNLRIDSRPPPPPLPLRLRPPLRKKKSFSHVATWLGFEGDQSHTRDLCLDSITNNPKPVFAGDGFYQVATPSGLNESTRRSSFESDETVSDWSLSDDAEDQTVPTSWSPSSIATIKAVDPSRLVLGVAPRRESVGVAF